MLKSTKSIRNLILAVFTASLFLTTSMLSADTIGWNLGTGGDWDTGTMNWTMDGGGRNDGFYVDGDGVTFTNSLGGAINLTADRAPGSTAVSATSGTYTFSGSSITSGTITKTGAGILEVNNTNTNVGTTFLTGGTIRLGATNALNPTTQLNGSTGGTLDLNGFDQTFASIQGSTNVILGGGAMLTINGGTDKTGGTFSGSGGFTKAVGGLLPFRGTSTYTGGTFVTGGILTLYGNNDNILPGTGDLTVTAPGKLVLNHHQTAGRTQTIGRLLGDGLIDTSLGANAANTIFVVGNGGGSSTFSGTYTGGGSLNKVGGGILTLDGNNTYTGPTTVEGGSLIVNGTTGLGQDDYTVKTGGTLGGSGTINLAATKGVTVESGGSIAPGTSPGTLTLNGDLTLLDGSFLNIEIGTISDLLVVNGLLTGATSVGGVTVDITNLGGAGIDTVAFLDWTGGSAFGVELSDFFLDPGVGTLSISGTQLLFTAAVPEPSSFLLLGLGALGLVRHTRRRRRA